MPTHRLTGKAIEPAAINDTPVYTLCIDEGAVRYPAEVILDLSMAYTAAERQDRMSAAWTTGYRRTLKNLIDDMAGAR